MDKDIISKHYEMIGKHYPGIKITQMGLTCLMLGVIRASMGHEHAEGTIQNYIHHDLLSDDVRRCVDFIERELLGYKKSKIDIGIWHKGRIPSYKIN
jgi:hypothetical protein